MSISLQCSNIFATVRYFIHFTNWKILYTTSSSFSVLFWNSIMLFREAWKNSSDLFSELFHSFKVRNIVKLLTLRLIKGYKSNLNLKWGKCPLNFLILTYYSLNYYSFLDHLTILCSFDFLLEMFPPCHLF